MQPNAPAPDYERLNAARWLAAMAVVLVHSASPSLANSEPYGTWAWSAANLYDSAMRWCVPVFVMISGALLLGRQSAQPVKTFYLKRGARVLMPLVFWTAFYLVWRMLLAWLDGDAVDWYIWLVPLVEGRPYYHLWYLYMLVGLYLFAPLIRVVYAHANPRVLLLGTTLILALAVISALYRAMTGAPYGFFLTWFLPFIGYFLAGRLIFEGKLRLPHAGWWLLGSVAVTVLGTQWLSQPGELNGYFYDNFSLTVPVMSIAVFSLVMSRPTLPQLSAIVPLTFGIYLVHPAIIDLALRTGLYRPGPAATWAIPVLAGAVFLVSAGVTWVMQQNRHTAKLI